MSGVFAALKARGFVEQASSPAIERLLDSPGVKCYVGFDPTADSLHLGHLVPVMGLAFLQRFGHIPIVLVGGATGMIGDPSGRSKERNLLTPEAVAVNARCIQAQLSRYIRFEGPGAAVMVDNNDWIAPMSHIDWLREVGKHFNVNHMLNKESVRKRLRESTAGLSYTEFSYMLLQAYDFLHLFNSMGCRLQAGGNDQWGNITAGIELVRKVCGQEVFGMTFPLITTASGRKFGKSEGDNVWLAPALTSAYDFHQYWMNCADQDVIRFLKLFTFLELDEIERLAGQQSSFPESRPAQRALAFEATRIVHGEEQAARARDAAAQLFGGVGAAPQAAPKVRLPLAKLAAGIPLADIVAAAGLSSSKRSARKLIEQGGLHLNGSKCTDPARLVNLDDLTEGKTIILRKGKRRFVGIEFRES